MTDSNLRDEALKRLKAKRHFWELLGVWVVVSIVLSLIWLLSGHGSYFWPVWPIAALAVATLFVGFDAYGPGRRVITDDDIDAEVSKMTRRGKDASS